MRMWRAAASVVTAAMVAATPAAQSKFTLKVHTGRGQVGYDVNSTMIVGERDVLLIDPQFSLSEAHKLAAEILETKKRLATIYSTHAHPDHLFGLAVLKQAFPEAKIVALPATVSAAKTGWPARQKFWFPVYGNNIPGPEPVLPEELATPVLTLEGEEFPITGGVQGADGPGNSFVYVPSLKAVITGDIVFDRVYFGVPRDAARQNWLKTVEQIAALKPADRHPRARRPRSHARHALDRVHEEVHRRLGRERRTLEDRRRDARERAPAVPGAGNGVHVERSRRDLFPGAAGRGK